jgi:hypothetical protein
MTESTSRNYKVVFAVALIAVFVCGVTFSQIRETRRPSFSAMLKTSDSMLRLRAAYSTGSQPDDDIRPDWRLTTECSAYSRDCVVKELSTRKYSEYPFQVGSSNWDRYTWEPDLPEGWETSLEKNIPKGVNKESGTNTFNSTRVNQCVQSAQALSVDEQVDNLLKRLDRTPSGMVSFIISDYSYAKDMMHDVFEMSDNVVGFKNSFFMVAIDRQTIELACQYDYPFLAWPQSSQQQQQEELGALKAAVANTKFEIGYALLLRNQPFFFFEMDVWFLRSPQTILETQTSDIVFSSHQDNPGTINIGVYSVLATDYSKTFFKLTIDLVKQSPEVHDQMAMQQLVWWIDGLQKGVPNDKLEYHGWWNKYRPPIPDLTALKNASIDIFPPHKIASHVFPLPTDETLAIHTLSGSPLQNPHGKKMVAKELGAWYGANDYYSTDNRYLWLDGHAWNGYSMTMIWSSDANKSYSEVYHNLKVLQWTTAATIALARRTNRIWVMPKIFGDHGVYFSWGVLDMKSVEEIVDVRETNFPTNPKGWKSRSVPYDPVARSALSADGRLFLQPSATASADNVRAWKLEEDVNPIDAWFAVHSTIRELDEAQVLMAGMPLGVEHLNRLREKVKQQKALSIAEKEIHEVWKQLKWCENNFSWDNTAVKATTDWDCFGRGTPASAM